MSWSNASSKKSTPAPQAFLRPTVPLHKPDWAHLVVLDFETYWDAEYTLSKLSTSEYVRSKSFKAHMVGIKVGKKKTRVIPFEKIGAFLKTINWATHDLLCHNTAFDGFILNHHFGIVPRRYYDTLSVARGLHSNDIGASLDEVAQYYGVGNKIAGVLDQSKGVLKLPKDLYTPMADYCAMDVELTLEIFMKMLEVYPDSEIKLIDLIIRMFCDPILRVDIPRVQTEYDREVMRREELILNTVDVSKYDPKDLLKGREKLLEGKERTMLMAKRVIGSNEKFADLLRAEHIDPPVKISPAWIKKPREERLEEDKWAYAFAKDDDAFITLPERIDEWVPDLDRNNPKHLPQIVARQERIQSLVDTRIAVKSTTNITRAARFLEAGRDGMKLPVGYAYYRAHTGRLGGNNKMNMQNLTRAYYDSKGAHITGTGELRLSILAPVGHQLVVGDSGQIECRVNGWLWDQDDLIEAFREADRGIGRDAYCNFAASIYGREITKADKEERFVGKVCLGPNTLVYTQGGLKKITEVTKLDFLWDGHSWVSHDGRIDQGLKETISYRGLCATADHEILTAHGWRAWSEVHTDLSLFQSALRSANLPSYGGNTTLLLMESLGAIDLFANVHVVPRAWSTLPASEQDVQRDVINAQKSQPVLKGSGRTKTRWPMMSIAHGFLTGFLQRSLVAVMRRIKRMSTMVREALMSMLSGSPIVLPSSSTSRHSTVGIPPSSRWIDATLIKDTSPAISVSYHVQKTPKTGGASKTSNSESASSKQITQTYDLVNAGPNQRFTIATNDGPVIVHNCVLGLGFMMGAAKLQITFAKGALGGPRIYFDLDRCKAIVNTYRRANYKIVQGWDICKQIIEDMAAGRTGSHKCISWEKETIWLPNGMALKYPDLRCEKNSDTGWDEWTYQSKDMRKKIYGGLLCENIVQALARIIVMDQMLELAKKRRPVMTTHDEIVAAVRTRSAATAYKELHKIMCTPPAWCPDIPLNSEGGYAENYSK